MFGENTHRPVMVIGSSGGFHHLAMLSILAHMSHVKVYHPTFTDIKFQPSLSDIDAFQQSKLYLVPLIEGPKTLSPIEKLLRNKQEPFSIVTIKNNFPRMPLKISGE